MPKYSKVIIPTVIILSVVSGCGYLEPEIPSVTPMVILTPPPILDSPYDTEGRAQVYDEHDPSGGLDPSELYEVPKWRDEWDLYEEHTVSSSPVPSSITMSKVCFYISLRNVNCRASDYVESSLIAILMEGEEAKLIFLNPTFTHGKFELATEQQCWMALWLMEGPEEPYKTCQISVVDAPPPLESSDPGDSDAPVCSSGMDQVSCEAAGGEWKSGATGASYCEC